MACLCERDLARLIVQARNTSQTLDPVSASTQLVATTLEALFYRDADAHDLGSRAFANCDEALEGTAVGQNRYRARERILQSVRANPRATRALITQYTRSYPKRKISGRPSTNAVTCSPAATLICP